MAKRIFLVEDEPSIVDIYETVFKGEGFNIEAFKLGEEVLTKLKEVDEKTKPDIILLDLVLPDMNGMDILKEIRAQENTKNIPVFILTNYSSQELQKEGHDLKAEKYITKADYTPKQIVDLVKERLKG